MDPYYDPYTDPYYDPYNDPYNNPPPEPESNTDAFLFQIDTSSASVIPFATFIGGRADERGLSAFLNDNGYLTLVGVTASDDLNTQNTGGLHGQLSGTSDAFLSIIDVWNRPYSGDPNSNDPMQKVSVWSSQTIISEDEGAIEVEFRLSAPLRESISVDYYTNHLSTSGGYDVASASGTMYFQPGEVTKTIQIDVYNDTEVEGDEAFELYVYNGNGVEVDTANSYLYFTIIQESATVDLQVLDDSATEQGQDPVTFSVSRQMDDLSAPLHVYLQTGGTAFAEVDYTGLTTDAEGRYYVEIAAGQSSATFTLTPVADAIAEDLETIVLQLDEAPEGAESYRYGNSVATATIHDTAPSVFVVPETIQESAGNTTFTIVRDGGDLSQPLTVYVDLAGTADVGEDYTFTLPTSTGAPTLQVESVSADAYGLNITFNRPIDPRSINLYGRCN